jgi:hypothetical protein
MSITNARAIIMASAASAFAGALGATAALLLVIPQNEDERALPVPASSVAIDQAMSRLAPVCRLVAHRSLKRALDQSRRAWISTDDLERLLGPLERGGAATCETINDQRFGLGGV